MPTTDRLWALPPDAAHDILARFAARLRPPECSAPPPAPAAGNPAAGASAAHGYDLHNGVAVIPISGTITRAPLVSAWTGQKYSHGQNEILAALESALSDPAARAILFDINSPGGTVAGAKELADRIAAVTTKPTAAYANGQMTSAAFWIGAATGRILAPATAVVGGIGVILAHADLSRLNEKMGISYSYITGGRWKSAGNENVPLTEEARALFQAQVSQLHEIFKADVARGLGVGAPAEQWAEGQTLLAGEAKKLGLVSAIVRDLTAAITTLRLEATMDLQTLSAQHPELLADIQQQARAEALKEAEARAKSAAETSAGTAAAGTAAIKEATASVLAVAKAVAGEAAHAQIAGLVRAGVTPAQLEALAPFLSPPEAASPQSKEEAAKAAALSREEAAKAAILAGLHAATPAPVTGAPPKNTDEAEARAAIERMSKL